MLFPQLEELYKAKKKPLEVTKLDLAAYFFTNMFSKSSSKELFINLTVFILLLLIEALPAVVRLKLEDSKYLSVVSHQKKLRDKTDTEMEAIENQIIEMKDFDVLPEKLRVIQIRQKLEEASKGGFQNIEELLKLAKELKQSQFSDTPVPAPGKVQANGQNEFPTFDHSKA